MDLRRIGCQYFLHFGDWSEITFGEEQKIISIVGEWANEPKRSNRSGKSSFVEIISYVLYGKTRAKKEIFLINKNYPEEDMICELEFDDGMIIRRGRTSDNQIILEMTGHEGADKKVVQEEIDNYIGLSYEDFIMTSFFLQGDIHTFMDAGPTGQSQIIRRWLEKGYWKQFEEEAKNRASEIQSQIDKLQLVVDDNPDPDRDNQIRERINILNNQKNQIETQLEALNKALEGFNNQLKKAGEKADVSKSIKQIKQAIQQAEEDIVDYESDIKEFDEKKVVAIETEKKIKQHKSDEDYNKAIATLKEKILELKKSFKTTQSKLSDLKAEFNRLKKQFESLKEFDAICPVTGNECTSLETIETSKADLRKEGTIKQKEITELDAELKVISDKIESLEEESAVHVENLNELKRLKKEQTVSEIDEKIKSLNEKIKSKKSLLIEQKALLKQKEKQLESLESIDTDDLQAQKNATNAQIADNKKILSDIINNVALQQAELQQIKQKRQKAAEAAKQIEGLTKKHSLHKYVAYMFGKNGIPSNQIESAFGEIEEEANLILESIGSDISIEFTPDRELDSWEPNCLVCGIPFPKNYRKTECPECGNERQKKKKDELNIIITTGGNEIDFNLESGGGKVLISLAIRLAFVRLLQRRIGVNLKLIVFDEIFGMLDEVNRQYVFKLLAKTLIDDFDFSQIFAISHEPEIRDSLPNVIKVTKHNKYSTFGWD